MMTLITINCQDNSVRTIRVEGNWSYSMALSLAQNIEGQNFKSASISK